MREETGWRGVGESLLGKLVMKRKAYGSGRKEEENNKRGKKEHVGIKEEEAGTQRNKYPPLRKRKAK